jgi:hypothetical protein
MQYINSLCTWRRKTQLTTVVLHTCDVFGPIHVTCLVPCIDANGMLHIQSPADIAQTCAAEADGGLLRNCLHMRHFLTRCECGPQTGHSWCSQGTPPTGCCQPAASTSNDRPAALLHSSATQVQKSMRLAPAGSSRFACTPAAAARAYLQESLASTETVLTPLLQLLLCSHAPMRGAVPSSYSDYHGLNL